jgi:hypothetical protein
MEFRCDLDGIWHCSVGCPHWPVESFNVIRMEKLPPDFELCKSCRRTKEFRRVVILVNAIRGFTYIAVPLLLIILAVYVVDCFAEWIHEE